MPKIQTVTDDATQLAEVKEQWAAIKQVDQEIEEAKENLKALRESREEALVRLGCIIADQDRPLLEDE